MQICGLQPVCGLLHMHCESAVLYSCQHALTLRKISSLSSEMLQKVQQEWQLLNVLMITWLSDCRSELVVFFKVCGIWGLDLMQGQVIFLFSKTSWLAPTLLFNGYGVICPVAKWAGCEFDHLPLSSPEVQNQWSYVDTTPVCLNCMDREDFEIFILLGCYTA